MNDLDRLRMVRDLLIGAEISTASGLGELANGIESLLERVGQLSDPLRLAYSNLWECLEVVGVRHQEAGTEPGPVELADLVLLADQLRRKVDDEISARGA